MSQLEAVFARWVVKYKWWVLIGTIAIAAGCASGMRFLTFNNDTRVYFSEENPQLQALEALENTYVKDDNILFVLAPKNGDVFTRKTLSAVFELTNKSWKMPHSSRVDSIANYQHTYVKGDDLVVRDLIPDIRHLSEAGIPEIKRIALSEPLLVNRLVSPSGHVTGVNIDIIISDDQEKATNQTTEVAAFARSLAQDIRHKYPDLDIYVAGGLMMDNAFGEATEHDMSTLVPGMYLTLTLIMGVMLRSISGTIASLIVVALSMTTGLGLAGWFNIALTTTSVNAPTIILTLAVADQIHILVTMFDQMRQGESKHKAMIESLRINLQPVLLTSVTTAIGFLTMNFSDAPPFRDFGNIVAMGIIAALIYALLLLPALMMVFPVRVRPIKEKHKTSLADSFANIVINYQKSLLIGIMLVCVVLTAGIFKIKLTDNYFEYFDKEYDFRQATDFARENLTGLDRIEYSLQSGEMGGINDPAYLNTVEAFAQWYRKQPKVAHVYAITDIVKRLNKNMNQDNEQYYCIPKSRELAAQYMLLYEMSLPFGLDLNDRIDVDKSATRMTVLLKESDTSELPKIDEKARDWLRDNGPKNMFTYGTGLSIIFAHISKRNISSMLSASCIALLMISVILAFALRSIKLGILSMIPNFAPAFVAFGLWGITVGEVGLVVSVVGAVSLGIVVDDTIHFISKYLRARREYGVPPANAIRYSFNTVSEAMVSTTLILVSGFMVLTFSGFHMNSELGLMTVMTLIVALLLDLLLLPILLLKGGI